ncbi:MAG: hypothetical protein IMW91_10320 [Firmicutes bacterium]|nr:hypothetical protein [Bacillota bacterium]
MHREAIGLLAGAGLLVVAVALHPLFADPWGSTAVLALIAGDRLWGADHLLMAAAMFFWIGSLANIGIREDTATTRIAVSAFVAGLTLWLLILALETTWIQPAARWAVGQSAELQTLTSRMGGFTLLAGDFAMVLIWLGLVALAQGLGATKRISLRMARFGRVEAWIGVGGLMGALIFRQQAVLWLAISAFVPFLWTGWLGIALLRQGASSPLQKP